MLAKLFFVENFEWKEILEIFGMENKGIILSVTEC